MVNDNNMMLWAVQPSRKSPPPATIRRRPMARPRFDAIIVTPPKIPIDYHAITFEEVHEKRKTHNNSAAPKKPVSMPDNPTIWTDDTKKKLKQLYDLGKCVMDISKEIDRSPAAVKHKLYDMGYKNLRITKNRKDPLKWTSEKLQIIRSMAVEGHTYKEIAEEFSISTDALRAIASIHKIKCIDARHQRKVPGMYTVEEDTALLKMRAAGIPIRNIAKVLNRSPSGIKLRLKRLREKI